MFEKVIIIAEAGVNHNGDIKLAKQLVDVAANCGVDYIKFQTWVTEELIDRNAAKAEYQLKNDGEGSQYDMLKRLELSFQDFREIKKHCEEKNVQFLSTPDELTSLNFLVDELGIELIKVGSGEVTNIPFLRNIGRKKKDVILSTGMASLTEVSRAYQELVSSGARSVAILHCTTSYPAPFGSINLNAMEVLRCAFKTTIGYSDHTEGNEVSIAAVAKGAKIIEKHFTLDKNMQGPDHKASLNPEELALLVKQIRNIEKALSGSGRKEVQQLEQDIRTVVMKGIYIKERIQAGEIIKEEKLLYKRPAAGVTTADFDMIINQRAKKQLAAGSPLKWSDIDF